VRKFVTSFLGSMLAFGVLFGGLVFSTTAPITSSASSETQDARSTKFPTAHQNWFNFECIGFKKVNGDVPFPVGKVVGEYDSKIADHSSVPPLRIGSACQRVQGDHGVVGINADHFGTQFCSRWNPGPNRIALNLDTDECRNHKREFLCSAVGQAIGAELYRRTPAGVAKGCLWTSGTGPSHVSNRERKVIISAWDRNPGDRIALASYVTEQRVEVPRNHVPCRYARSNHCTHSGKMGSGTYSWWRGANLHKNYVTPHRAKIRMQTYFRYYNWTFDGRLRFKGSSHPYCWDNGSNVRCGDGAFKLIG